MVPSSVIIICFIVAFLMVSRQYYQIDPKRRLLNLRFAMMLAAFVVAFGYPIFVAMHPGHWQLSWAMLALGLAWIAVAWVLHRYMPPRDTY